MMISIINRTSTICHGEDKEAIQDWLTDIMMEEITNTEGPVNLSWRYSLATTNKRILFPRVMHVHNMRRPPSTTGTHTIPVLF
jgi:hypothetical protein